MPPSPSGVPPRFVPHPTDPRKHQGESGADGGKVRKGGVVGVQGRGGDAGTEEGDEWVWALSSELLHRAAPLQPPLQRLESGAPPRPCHLSQILSEPLSESY